MRPTHPWYWAEKNSWYVEVGEKRHFLGKHPDGVPPPKKRKKGDPRPTPPPEIKQRYYVVLAQVTGQVPKEALRAIVICKMFLTAIFPYAKEAPEEKPKATDPQPELKPKGLGN